MRCKKHITDHSSAIGVCASCLRQRLFLIMAAQADQEEEDLSPNEFNTTTIGTGSTDNNNTPQVMFPRSVSPYISRRKSDIISSDSWARQQEIQFQRFFSTPHIGPTGKIVAENTEKKKKQNIFGFSLFGSLFGSKSKKSDSGLPGTDSRSWLETMSLGSRRRKKAKNLPNKEERTTISRKAEKGMSPSRNSDEDEEYRWNNELSGSLSECSKQWNEKETPKRTPAWIPPGKRGGSHGRNSSGFGFCFSPLVKPSPSRNWNKKVIPPE